VLISACRFFFPIAALPKADCLLRDDGFDDGVDDGVDSDKVKTCRRCRCRCDIVREWIIVDTGIVDPIVVVGVLPIPPIILRQVLPLALALR